MKKIIFISESMGGGLRKHIVQLLEGLTKDKYEIYLIHGTLNLDSAFLQKYEDLSKKVTMIPCESFTREISLMKDSITLRFINKKIREIKPDIVHCHSSKGGALGRISAKICNVKEIFYTPHAYSFLAPEFSESKKKLYIVIERLLSKFFTNKTFCVSKNELNEAIKRKIDKEDKFEVIYNGLSIIEFLNRDAIREDLGFNSNDIIIGNNARLTNQKNPMLFFEIAKKIVEKNTKYKFVWIGSGPLKESVTKYIIDNNLTDNVKLINERPDAEFIVSGYDYYLSTSLYEGLPYAPIEALRAGVPVILSDVVGHPEIIISSSVGGLYNLDDKEIMMGQINNYLNKNYFKKKIIDEFEQYFSLSRMLTGLERNYDDFC